VFHQATPSNRDRHTDRPREDGVVRVRTDGGRPSTGPPDEAAGNDQSRFQTLFVDITGTKTIVERQTCGGSSRMLDEAGDDDTVSEYLTEIAREDGLADTRSNPEPEP